MPDHLPYTLHLGDCLLVLKTFPDNSFDSVVTDPPYGLTTNKKGGTGVASVNLDSPYGRSRIGTGNGAGGFMGMKWDSDVPPVEVWTECLRVLKPGGYLLAFAGTRTQHRMALRIEDAGFEIRDMIAWVYGSGFPKSKNLDGDRQGWGTALKPALEPITVARKPLHRSSGSQNPGSFQSEGTDKTSQNNHPTVKPTDLMAYLVRLVTPPGGKVLDPFTGSGSTGKAAVREGFEFVGIEREAPYLAIAEARIAHELERVTAAAEEAAKGSAQLDIFHDANEHSGQSSINLPGD
ncbi:TPA: site-specific DNA-methyltransferase [Pseudomonas aeruginosa]|nr:site-specific DNA-methyltransferase [Pseudomonas aeruginosa]HBO4515061.1 site-specific DNA-methyltransferase [Pseudomonas aeruginosa]